MLGMEREHPRRMISDRVWEQLKAALAEAKHSRAGVPAELSDRDFLEAVWYLNRVGCPWRDLPSELGYWHAVSMRFRRWEERGVWRRLWQCLQCECFAQARHLLMDSTTVRAHQHAAGAPKNGGDQALGRSRGGLSTKIHAATIDENCSVALHLGMPTRAVSLNLSMRAWIPTMCSNRPPWTKAMMPTAFVSA